MRGWTSGDVSAQPGCRRIHNYRGTFHVYAVAAPQLPIAQRGLRKQIDFVRAVLVGLREGATAVRGRDRPNRP